ncbi:MAG: biotin/lipoyl-containing protein [Bacteroidota bacterium]
MRTYTFSIQGRTFKIAVKEVSQTDATVEVDGETYSVRIDDISDSARTRPVRATPRAAAAKGAAKPVTVPPAQAADAGSVTAPIPGLILSVLVREGEEVTAGTALVKMEAMKMETVVSASTAGTITSISVSAGDSVTQGQQLMAIE